MHEHGAESCACTDLLRFNAEMQRCACRVRECAEGGVGATTNSMRIRKNDCAEVHTANCPCRVDGGLLLWNRVPRCVFAQSALVSPAVVEGTHAHGVTNTAHRAAYRHRLRGAWEVPPCDMADSQAARPFFFDHVHRRQTSRGNRRQLHLHGDCDDVGVRALKRLHSWASSQVTAERHPWWSFHWSATLAME